MSPGLIKTHHLTLHLSKPVGRLRATTEQINVPTNIVKLIITLYSRVISPRLEKLKIHK